MSVEGFTVWLTGLPSAGKSTLAAAVSAALVRAGRRVEVLDGDDIRNMLSPELGFTKVDREINIRRIGYIARLLARNGVIVVVAAIAPYRTVRDKVRESHDTPYVEVFVDCALSELQRRDAKGLYARAIRGEVSDFTGISAPYEPPFTPEIHLRTDRDSIDACASAILSYLERRGLVAMSAQCPQ